MVERARQSPPVGSGDNREQNISMGREEGEGAVAVFDRDKQADRQTAGLRGRDQMVEEESQEQQPEKVLSAHGGVSVGLYDVHFMIVGVCEVHCGMYANDLERFALHVNCLR